MHNITVNTDSGYRRQITKMLVPYLHPGRGGKKMSQTAQDRWNAAHYKQMKFSVHPSVAVKFKSVCEKQRVSMASVIMKLMCDYSEIDRDPLENPIRDMTATRRLRRKEMCSTIKTVEAILNAESRSLSKIPENFQDSDTYVESERIVEALETALDSLEDVYNS
jgi:hypothetical protein